MEPLNNTHILHMNHPWDMPVYGCHRECRGYLLCQLCWDVSGECPQKCPCEYQSPYYVQIKHCSVVLIIATHFICQWFKCCNALMYERYKANLPTYLAAGCSSEPTHRRLVLLSFILTFSVTTTIQFNFTICAHY